MAFDLASIANRMAPGLAGSSPPATAFALGANAQVQLRAAAGAARFYSIKVVGAAGASCTVATGTAGLAAPTAADPIFDLTDSWQDMILGVGATHIRLFGIATAGTLYIWDRGS